MGVSETEYKNYQEREIHYKLVRRGRVGTGSFAYRAKVFDRYWRLFGDKLST